MPEGPKSAKQSLKHRREVFCRAYVAEGNATKAALAAGYSKKTSYSQGNRLLKKAEIQRRIAVLTAQKLDKFDIKADKVLGAMAALAKANMQDYVVIGEDGQAHVDLSNLTREQAYAIQEIKVDATGGTGDGERRRVLRTTFKLAGKEKPLEMLARHLKLLTDRMEITGLEGLADMLRTRRKAAG